MSDLLYKICARSIMIIVWIALVLMFLFFPRFFDTLYPHESSSINLYVFPMLLDGKKLLEFEQKTGIKVYMHYYESNEELLQKIQITGGKGYDLIVAVDYVVDALKKKNLLQAIDTTKLAFVSQIQSSLLHYYFDPDNRYSVPYAMSVYGLGIDPTYFGSHQPEPTWDLLFKQQPGYEVAITDVPRRAIAFASNYLYGTTDISSDPEKLKAVEQLLTQQKKWVRMYTDIRGEDLLATKNCPVVMTIASDLWMIKREYPHLEFKVPKEGTFVTIDSFVIPAVSTKQDLVYQFLNYIYESDIISYHCRQYGFCPPLVDVDIQGTGIFCPTQEQVETFNFFNTGISDSVVNDIWISVISH